MLPGVGWRLLVAYVWGRQMDSGSSKICKKFSHTFPHKYSIGRLRKTAPELRPKLPNCWWNFGFALWFCAAKVLGNPLFWQHLHFLAFFNGYKTLNIPLQPFRHGTRFPFHKLCTVSSIWNGDFEPTKLFGTTFFAVLKAYGMVLVAFLSAKFIDRSFCQTSNQICPHTFHQFVFHDHHPAWCFFQIEGMTLSILLFNVGLASVISINLRPPLLLAYCLLQHLQLSLLHLLTWLRNALGLPYTQPLGPLHDQANCTSMRQWSLHFHAEHSNFQKKNSRTLKLFRMKHKQVLNSCWGQTRWPRSTLLLVASSAHH